ncbi:MAG: metal-dependent transcriptional regulator [Candidatus Cryosericum sp.]|nr:FeoA domain-containing protein [bacterium]
MSSEKDSITSEDREECLEALCRLERAHRPSTAAELAAQRDLAGKHLSELLLDLAMSGDVAMNGSSVSLTSQGRAVGRRIVRRHQLAERMLCMLGLQKDTAHKEACKLEHVLTDAEAADLEKHMSVVTSLMELGAVTLGEAVTGRPYTVRWIRGGQQVRRRLEDMGLGQGSVVTVCNRQSGGPVEVEAHGACVALGRGIAQKILVIPREER